MNMMQFAARRSAQDEHQRAKKRPWFEMTGWKKSIY